MGDISYLANGFAHSAITMFAEKLRIGTVIIVKKKKSESYSLRICGSKIGNFGGIFEIL